MEPRQNSPDDSFSRPPGGNPNPPTAQRANRGGRRWAGPLGILLAILLSVGLVGWRGILRDIQAMRGIKPPQSRVPWITSMHKAMALARADHQLILADFHADWCLPCRRMNRVVWTSRRVAAAVHASFIPLSVDVDSNRGKLLAHNFMVRLLPSVLIIDTHGEVLAAENFMDKAQTLAFLKQSLATIHPSTTRASGR